jgi:hypothetical protein
MTRGYHDKAAEQARTYCMEFGRLSIITRPDNNVVFRMLMRKMTPEERRREEGILKEEKRQEFLKWQDEMREAREKAERALDEKAHGKRAEENGGAGAGAGADADAEMADVGEVPAGSASDGDADVVVVADVNAGP